MEDCSYISCIKINGVPILPPMITESMKEELLSYKERAINVEKKLAALRIAEKYNNDIYVETINESKDIKYRKEVSVLEENFVPFQYKSNNYNVTNITNTNNVSLESFESSSENLEIEYKSEDQINAISAAVSKSDPIIINIDESYRLDETTSTRSSTMGTISDTWKPKVPRTLNITPLTLNDSNCKENEETDSDNVGGTPKLIRQSSYVLETPSPILLAHMQMQLDSTDTPCSEYVPTSCTDMNPRNERNVMERKIEWEYERESKDKESAAMESLKSSRKRNSYSDDSHRILKLISLQKESDLSFGTCPSTKSAECIRTMLSKGCLDKNDTHVDHAKKPTDSNKKKRQKLETRIERCNTSAAINSVDCKLGSSLDNPNLKEHNANDLISNDLTEKLSENLETENSSLIPKLKSSIASDKLLIVYKKVQEMHKKQMTELMVRQQREQTLLQKEFENQQLLLLTEIKKSFPGISVSLLSEGISVSPAVNDNQTILNGSKTKEMVSENNGNTIVDYVGKLKIDLERRENEVEHSQDNMKIVSCPLDYIYSEINYNSVPCSTKYSSNINNFVLKTDIEKRDTEIQAKDRKEMKVSEESDECKRSNVSRKLFPLDSNTVRVPILDRTIYTDEHITAANTINAYARGYLVRRMMRTERVIALKNTYKEALHCMLKLHVDAPLNRSEFNFLHRLQLQCDAASMNIVELFAQNPQKRMQIIAQDREIKQFRIERPTSARSYSFATQRTLARKKLKEYDSAMEEYQPTSFIRSCTSRSRCQTWTSDIKERLISSNVLNHSIKRSTSAGTVRKPWR